jgi:hypothetical protein
MYRSKGREVTTRYKFSAPSFIDYSGVSSIIKKGPTFESLSRGGMKPVISKAGVDMGVYDTLFFVPGDSVPQNLILYSQPFFILMVLVTLIGIRIGGSLPATKERHLRDFSGIIIGIGDTYRNGAR